MIPTRQAVQPLVTIGFLIILLVSFSWADPIDPDKLKEQIIKYADIDARNREAVESANISFYRTYSPGPFKPTATFEHCAELVAKHNLVHHPEALRDLLNEIYEFDKPVQTPWSEMEMHQQSDEIGGVWLREARHLPGAEPDVHILTPELSLRWNEANSQLDVDHAKDSRLYITSFEDFLPPSHLLRVIQGATEVESSDLDGHTARRYKNAAGARFTTIDAESGFPLADDSSLGQRAHLRRWLGWSKAPSGVWFPRVVIDLNFENAKLRRASFYIVRDARFNVPISKTVFKLGAPAGSVIVDNRQGRGERIVKINRDVFDASSVEEVDEATKPVDEKYSEIERAAHVELRRLYFLHPDEVIKRIAPPFPLSRKYLPRMLNPKHVSDRRTVHFDVIQWKDDKLKPGSFVSGLSPKLSHLLTGLLKQPITGIDIPKELLDREMPGDYIYRPDTPRDKLAEGLSKILSDDVGREVKLTFRDVDRPVYVARGKLDLVPAKLSKFRDKPLIAVHGGPHDGDHVERFGFGDHASLVSEVSEYINTKIVDETPPSKEDLAWSTRWYDLPRTPAEKRFQIDPQKVLKLVQEQTGISFVEEKQTVTELTLEEM